MAELRVGTSPRQIMAVRLIVPDEQLRAAGWRASRLNHTNQPDSAWARKGKLSSIPVIDTGMVVGELLVAMRNAKLAQPPHEPAGTVDQIELILLAAVDVERLQPAEIVRLGFDRNGGVVP